MGASHSVEASDTKMEEIVDTTPVAEEEEEEEEEHDPEDMNWFWPII